MVPELDFFSPTSLPLPVATTPTQVADTPNPPRPPTPLHSTPPSGSLVRAPSSCHPCADPLRFSLPLDMCTCKGRDHASCFRAVVRLSIDATAAHVLLCDATARSPPAVTVPGHHQPSLMSDDPCPRQWATSAPESDLPDSDLPSPSTAFSSPTTAAATPAVSLVAAHSPVVRPTMVIQAPYSHFLTEPLPVPASFPAPITVVAAPCVEALLAPSPRVQSLVAVATPAQTLTCGRSVPCSLSTCACLSWSVMVGAPSPPDGLAQMTGLDYYTSDTTSTTRQRPCVGRTRPTRLLPVGCPPSGWDPPPHTRP
jgi:hypothetical protein